MVISCGLYAHVCKNSVTTIENHHSYTYFIDSHSIINGFGHSACWTSILSTFSNLFPDKLGRNLAFISLALGLGFVLGPIFAAGLYKMGGFSLPFFTIAIFQLPVAFGMAQLVPNDHSYRVSISDEDASRGLLVDKKQLKLIDLLIVSIQCSIYNIQDRLPLLPLFPESIVIKPFYRLCCWNYHISNDSSYGASIFVKHPVSNCHPKCDFSYTLWNILFFWWTSGRTCK